LGEPAESADQLIKQLDWKSGGAWNHGTMVDFDFPET